MELWQYYKETWKAERALKAAVPTAWLVKGGVAFAVVKFPQVAEPGEWWVGVDSHAVDFWQRPIRRGGGV